MPCQRATLPDGTGAIVCGSRRRLPKCVGCGKPAPLLCDWKTPEGKKPTCDAPLCATCAHEPAPNKHLCPVHTAQWAITKARRDKARRATTAPDEPTP